MQFIFTNLCIISTVILMSTIIVAVNGAFRPTNGNNIDGYAYSSGRDGHAHNALRSLATQNSFSKLDLVEGLESAEIDELNDFVKKERAENSRRSRESKEQMGERVRGRWRTAIRQTIGQGMVIRAMDERVQASRQAEKERREKVMQNVVDKFNEALKEKYARNEATIREKEEDTKAKKNWRTLKRLNAEQRQELYENLKQNCRKSKVGEIIEGSRKLRFFILSAILYYLYWHFDFVAQNEHCSYIEQILIDSGRFLPPAREANSEKDTGVKNNISTKVKNNGRHNTEMGDVKK